MTISLHRIFGGRH